jgi:hypothetical protein
MQPWKVCKRAFMNITDKSILHALGLQCSCNTQCSDRWNKGNLRQTCQSYAFLHKLEQLYKVYEILLSVQNLTTRDITLMVGVSSKSWAISNPHYFFRF